MTLVVVWSFSLFAFWVLSIVKIYCSSNIKVILYRYIFLERGLHWFSFDLFLSFVVDLMGGEGVIEAAQEGCDCIERVIIILWVFFLDGTLAYRVFGLFCAVNYFFYFLNNKVLPYNLDKHNGNLLQ